MKARLIVPALFILATLFFYAFKPFQTVTGGPHGGTLKQVENYHIELKKVNSSIYTYLLDPKLKPISNKEMSCTIKFFLPDSATMDVAMKPSGADGFISESNAFAYQSCKVIFKMPERSISAIFENENIIVNINK
jgi:hypothetical protein